VVRLSQFCEPITPEKDVMGNSCLHDLFARPAEGPYRQQHRWHRDLPSRNVATVWSLSLLDPPSLILSFLQGLKESGGCRRDSEKNLTTATDDTFLRNRRSDSPLDPSRRVCPWATPSRGEVLGGALDQVFTPSASTRSAKLPSACCAAIRSRSACHQTGGSPALQPDDQRRRYPGSLGALRRRRTQRHRL
jgi:hypothetical protein